MKLSTGRVLRWGLSLAAAVLLVLAARRVNWALTWQVVRAASPALLVVASAVNLASLLAKGVRWWVFLRGVAPVPVSLALRATVVGSGLNNVLLANGGEAARVLLVARRTGLRTSTVVATLALERLYGLFGYVLLLVLATRLLPLPRELERARLPATVGLGVLAALIALLLRWAPAERAAVAVDPVLARPSRLATARVAIARFAARLAHLTSGRRLAAAVLLTGAEWVGQIVTYHLTARAAHFPLSLAATVAALLAVNIGFLVRATPGNVGVFQAVYALTVSAFGFDAHAAVAAALLIQALQIIPITLLAFALAPHLVMHPPASDVVEFEAPAES